MSVVYIDTRPDWMKREMERMNDVTKYLIDCQKEYLGQKT